MNKVYCRLCLWEGYEAELTGNYECPECGSHRISDVYNDDYNDDME